MQPEPPTVDPAHLVSALSQELARVNDNRIYLLALVEQQAAQLRQLEPPAEPEPASE